MRRLFSMRFMLPIVAIIVVIFFASRERQPAAGPAPGFSLPMLDGSRLKLSDLKGSVVVLDFWATWCGPCMESLPHLDRLYRTLSPQGLKVIAVNLQEDKQTVQTVVDRQKWAFPIALDLTGEVATLYKAEAIPETVVIGRDGLIKQVFVGGGQQDDISALVAKEMK